ncbi:hypothetical protein PY650_27290 [Rhizobium calliandrae]|uniref:Uncharacterized protein n=1 Tax=Rhizobium calliandrae TaxID=1312182 RepID=A0ABT7KLH5_9HYPH|nr:hypothetical protein [Rhizobium calliandrae]MDL2409271.1 hypothetical protein [Rhizobium calliandrae]
MPLNLIYSPAAEANIAVIAPQLPVKRSKLAYNLGVAICNALQLQTWQAGTSPPLPTNFYLIVPYTERGTFGAYMVVNGAVSADGNSYIVGQVGLIEKQKILLASPNQAYMIRRSAVALAPPPPVQPSLPAPPTVLFQGYSSFSGAGLQTAVGGDEPSPTFTDSIDRCTVLTDFTSLATFFEVSATASVNEFLVDSADAKASFLNSLHITQFSVVIAIYRKETASLSVTSQVNLLPSVSMPTTKGELLSFVTSNGDSWVNSITSASEYVACYVFYSMSLDEQEAVKAQISGKIIEEDGSASAGFTTAQQSKLEQISTRSLFVGQSFGLDISSSGLDASNLLDVGQIATMVTRTTAQNSGWIIAYGGLPYENINGFLPLIKETELPANRITYAQLAPWADKLQARIDQVNAVVAIYDAYGYAGDTKIGTISTIGTWAQAMSTDWQELVNQIQELTLNPLDPPSNPGAIPPGSLSYGVPMLNYFMSPQTPPLWGGSSGPGDAATYVDSSIILGGNVLEALTIDGGAEVNYVQMKYTNLSDPILLGRQEGGSAKSWPLQPEEGERVATVSVTAGALINQLTVTTNKGLIATWPRTPHKAAPQNPWPPTPGLAFVGFAVTFNASGSDHCLKTLTPVSVTFQPANWTGAGTDKT